MDWFFENLGKIISFIIFIVYILYSIKGKGGDEEEQDPDAIERARRIQEEIRRKILQRQQGSSPSSGGDAPPPIVFEEEEQAYREPEPWRPAPPPIPTQQAEPPPPVSLGVETTGDPFAKQRRQIEEQLQKAKELRAVALDNKKREGFAISERSSISASQLSGKIRAHLKDASTLKVAIVVKEILDTPIGLR